MIYRAFALLCWRAGKRELVESSPDLSAAFVISMCSILLVDDDSSVLLTLSIALRRCGHEVTVAGDGQQALNQLHRQNFDAMISDIRMPGMSGLELAAHVKKLKNPPRIILTSAHYDPSLKPNPAEIAEAFLQKPLEIAALCRQLENTPKVRKSFRTHRERTLRRVKRLSRHRSTA